MNEKTPKLLQENLPVFLPSVRFSSDVFAKQLDFIQLSKMPDNAERGIKVNIGIYELIEMIESFRQSSIMRAAGVMGDKLPCVEGKPGVPDDKWLEGLVWYKKGGENHGALPETWRDRAEELGQRVKELEEEVESLKHENRILKYGID